jgi:hypothetical protein
VEMKLAEFLHLKMHPEVSKGVQVFMEVVEFLTTLDLPIAKWEELFIDLNDVIINMEDEE